MVIILVRGEMSIHMNWLDSICLIIIALKINPVKLEGARAFTYPQTKKSVTILHNLEVLHKGRLKSVFFTLRS